MNDIMRSSESSYQQTHFEALFKEVENKVDKFCESFLSFPQ